MPLLETARRMGVTRGVFGDSRPWLVIGGVAWAIRAIQWARRPAPATVLREVLEAGETVVITHEAAPPTRRQELKASRRARRSARAAVQRAERSDADATAATVEALSDQPTIAN